MCTHTPAIAIREERGGGIHMEMYFGDRLTTRDPRDGASGVYYVIDFSATTSKLRWSFGCIGINHHQPPLETKKKKKRLVST